MKTLVTFLIAATAFAFANEKLSSSPVVITDSSEAVRQFQGGGSECLGGCTENDYCITNDRKKIFNPHYECRFSWMPYNCTNYDETWCNRIFSTCANPVDQLSETRTGVCAPGVPPRDPL